QIAIDQENIDALQRFLKLFAAIKEGGDISQLQVDTVEQQLVQGISQKLTDEQEYGTAIDQFHIQLGLPVDLPIELDDSAIRDITQQYRRYEQLFLQYNDATQVTAKFGAEAEADQLRRRLRELIATAPVTAGTRFRTEFPTTWSGWEKLNNDEVKNRLTQLREERQRLLDRQADLDREGKTLSDAEQSRLAQLDADLDLGS